MSASEIFAQICEYELLMDQNDDPEVIELCSLHIDGLHEILMEKRAQQMRITLDMLDLAADDIAPGPGARVLRNAAHEVWCRI
jgi:hypothetical protein